jgi:hypothetical protein
MGRQSIEEFRTYLMEESYLSAHDMGTGNTLPFIEKVIQELQDTSFINDPKTFYWSGKGASNSEIILFGYDYDNIDNSVSIYTGIFADTPNIATISRSQIDEKVKRGLRFAKECLVTQTSSFIKSLENDVADFKDLIIELENRAPGISKIKVVFITNDKLSDRVKKIESNLIIKNIPTEVQVWDIERLYNLIIVANADHEDIEIDLPAITKNKSGISFLEVPQDEENHFSCFLTVLPGDLLAQIYFEYGSQLLEGNVRSFLSTKTATNKKIQATINTEPSKFFVYNNGISATATDVEFSSGQIRKIKNFQIINGGQTTASLAYAKYKRNIDISKISVQMKLTIVKETDSIELANTIQKISRSSNSQNKVSDADFFANHEFHILIEKISLQTQAPPAIGTTFGTYWFYERAKGQYTQKKMFLSSNERARFERSHPKEKLLSKTDFAKFHNIWKGHPEVVSRGAMTNFNYFAKMIEKDWEIPYKRSNYNEFFFKQICCIALLYRKLEKEITISRLDWYHGSYRANVIVYTLSLFFKLMHNQFPDRLFNFQRLWDDQDQELNEKLIGELLILAKEVYQELTSTNRGVENVTQWCKRDSCWENISNKLIRHPIDIENIMPYLVSSSIIQDVKKDARKAQQLDNEIDLLSQVASKEKFPRWKFLPSYLEQHKSEICPTMAEMKAVDSVIKMCAGRGGNVSNQVCRLALDIWDKAINNGWK